MFDLLKKTKNFLTFFFFPKIVVSPEAVDLRRFANYAEECKSRVSFNFT